MRNRESWMTEIPKGELKIDPLKLKNRQFIQKPSSLQDSREPTEQELQRINEQEELVRNYNETNRPESLMDIYKRDYSGKKKGEEDKDLNSRKFDWERDMNSGIKGGSAKDTSDLMSKFGSINSRFTTTKKFL